MSDIWILEDDDSIREIIKIVLEDNGYTTKSFSKCGVLETALKASLPDLLILDVLLQNENGIDISRRFRENPNLIDLPIILMSANIISKEAISFSKANDFLKKPFDIQSLIQIVTKNLPNKK